MQLQNWTLQLIYWGIPKDINEQKSHILSMVKQFQNQKKNNGETTENKADSEPQTKSNRNEPINDYFSFHG